MPIRPKTVKRLVALFVIVGLLVGAGVWAYARNERLKAERIERYGVEGKQAFADEDYETALEKLSKYVARHPDDRDAVYAYAISRGRIPTPDGRYVGESRQALNTLLQRYPDDAEARHALLDIYLLTGQNAELLVLADQILAAKPADAPALRAKSVALIRQNKLDDALAASLKYNEAEPLDLPGHIQTQKLMTRLRRTGGEIVERYQALLDEHPGEAKFQLLLALAHGAAGDAPTALATLRTAAATLADGSDPDKAIDPDVVRQIAYNLDRLRLYDDSQQLLEKVVARTSDDRVLLTLVTRLWQDGRRQEIADRLKSLDPADAKVDPQLPAYRALALFEMGKPDEATPVVRALAGRNEPAAKAWAGALAARFDATLPPVSAEGKDLPALARIEQLKKSLGQVGGAQPGRSAANATGAAVFAKWVGDAYNALGETPLAIRNWDQAAAAMPSWAEPVLLIAQAQLADNKLPDAYRAAAEAERRARTPAVQLNSLTVRYNLIVQNAGGVGAEVRQAATLDLLDDVKRVQAAARFEPVTLPMYVDLLARTGDRDGAKRAVQDAVAANVSPDTRLRLAAVSRANDLGLAPELVAAGSGAKTTPALALADAKIRSDTERPEAILDGLKRLAKENGNTVGWQLAVARWLEETNDPAARAAWVDLGDQHPDDLAVQRTIVESAGSARADRRFTGRTIDRLKALTGDAGQQWKLERAKWLLDGGEDGAKSHEETLEAVNTLMDLVRAAPDQIEARVWYSRALEQAGSVPGAIDNLRAAADRDRRDPRAAFELIRLLQNQDKPDEVRQYANRLADVAVLTDRQRPDVAALLARLGELDRAVAVLDPAARPGADAASAQAGRDALSPDAKLLLADLYRRQGKGDQAGSLYDQLLARPAPGAEALLHAADYYAESGEGERAKQTLDRLGDDAIAPADRAAALARFEERHGSPDKAAEYYAQAVLLAPDRPAFWAAQVGFEQRRDDHAKAAEVAARAVARLPDEPSLKEVKAEADALLRSRENPEDLDALIDVLARDPGKSAQVDALRAIRKVRESGGTDADLADRLQSVAERYPRFYPLQKELVQLLTRVGRSGDAAAVATRTAEALPRNAEAAGLAVAAARAAGQWPAMRQAADRMKAQFGDDADAALRADVGRRADVAYAEASVNLGAAQDALARLRPYLPDAPDDVAAVAARAYAASGREDDARALLEGKLTGGDKAPAWRALWTQVATDDLATADAAKRWLDEVDKATPAGTDGTAPLEQARLATAWATVGEKFGDEPALRRAAGALAALPNQSDPAVQYRSAQLALRLGDLSAAESGLTAVLKAIESDDAKWGDAARAAVQNDLANVLLRKLPDPLAGRASDADRPAADRALALATVATRLDPSTATFHDTRARAAAATGDDDAAEAAFLDALSRDPNSLDALAGLARHYRRLGDENGANRLIAQIDLLLRDDPVMSPELRAEIQGLRTPVSDAGR